MLQALQPVLKNRKKARHILEDYWQNNIAVIWSAFDVLRAANQCELVLTVEEARTVLKELHEANDPNSGITWEIVRNTIKERGVGRKLTEEERQRFTERNIVTVQKSANRD